MSKKTLIIYITLGIIILGVLGYWLLTPKPGFSVADYNAQLAKLDPEITRGVTPLVDPGLNQLDQLVFVVARLDQVSASNLTATPLTLPDLPIDSRLPAGPLNLTVSDQVLKGRLAIVNHRATPALDSSAVNLSAGDTALLSLMVSPRSIMLKSLDLITNPEAL